MVLELSSLELQQSGVSSNVRDSLDELPNDGTAESELGKKAGHHGGVLLRSSCSPVCGRGG
jgi:hypothetical protein